MTGSEFDLTFPRAYECELVDELPHGEPPRQFAPTGQKAGRDGVLIRVRPTVGNPWTGTFAFGRFGPAGVTRVASMPDATRLAVVARGAGYIVKAAEPNDWEQISLVPVIDVRAGQPMGLLIFANHTQMVAYGPTGVAWSTRRISWDSLEILDVGVKSLSGQYWDIRQDAMQTFEVDLTTGAVKGGIES